LAIGCLILTFFGWRIFFKIFTVFLFLFFMLPLPNRINQTVSLQLQELSTVSAVWLLEAFGYVVVRQGNVINIGDTSVAVAEACNGLRMITAFFIIASWLALLVHRKKWEKAIVILSALPIAILCNTIRLALTAVAFTMIDVDKYGALFHDWGGYAMMPLAVGLIALELWILSNLVIEPKLEKQEQVVIVSRKN
jgi:exosortase